jgi:uncharacterized 2Fe-2S/4Fe-4S cluster protein (DUF4445 family)
LKRIFNIKFLPSHVTTTCMRGDLVLQVGRNAGLYLTSFCGGAAVCGKCKIKILHGYIEPSAVDHEFLDQNEINSGVRLACQARVTGDCTVQVMFDESGQTGPILTRGRRKEVSLQPAVKKEFINITPPSLAGNPFDLDDLLHALAGPVAETPPPIDLIQELPSNLRNNNYQGTAVTHLGKLIDFQNGDTRLAAFGLAVDLGTTTVVGSLTDFNSGRVIAVSAALNGQRSCGEDVISRISYSNTHGVQPLQRAAVQTINEIIDDCVQKSGINRHDIYELTVAGNTVMLHFLSGVSPRCLAEYPYVPVFRGPFYREAVDFGIHIHRHGHVYLFPAIGRYVGGDTVAMVLTLLDDKDKTWLAVDIGTNGEIVLFHAGKRISTSTAAGPAFEGAHIHQGMRAMAGAIDHVFFHENEIHYHVIDNVPAQGICGSGLIDLLAVLLKTGLVSESGKLLSTTEGPDSMPASLAAHLRIQDGQTEFIFDPSQHEHEVVVTQQDVRELQLAKGAIAAGIDILLKQKRLSITDVDAVFLAGAFGQYIVKENAIAIGLLPDIAPAKVHFIGNAACAGAEMALLSLPQRARAREIAHSTEYIELSTDPDFFDVFAEKMLLMKK